MIGGRNENKINNHNIDDDDIINWISKCWNRYDNNWNETSEGNRTRENNATGGAWNGTYGEFEEVDPGMPKTGNFSWLGHLDLVGWTAPDDPDDDDTPAGGGGGGGGAPSLTITINVIGENAMIHANGGSYNVLDGNSLTLVLNYGTHTINATGVTSGTILSETATIPGTAEITFDFTQKAIPGFELITMLGAIAIGCILIKRGRKK